MFMEAYKQALNVLKKKPLMLWGLSLLSMLICVIAILGTLWLLPLGIAFSFVVYCGMSKVYLDGLHGKEVNSNQLFEGFKRFFRIAGGMAWMYLWVFIWALIPFAGVVMAIIKSYEYRFVPYILMTRPEVTATEALRLSMQMTKGKKLQMFLADLLLVVGVYVVIAVLFVLTMIPFIGRLFALVLLLVYLCLIAFLPIFEGLYSAAFFEMPAQDVPSAPQNENN